jgi:CheY-like chemotaxis protein
MTKQIVWVEDDAYIIWSVVRPLEDRGYKIIAMGSMREALERIEELRNCDLILLDVILPAGDERWEKERHIGVHLLRNLREQSVTTPVLAFTVVGKPETRKELRDLGVVDVLNKPILPSELERAVLAILGGEE